jgi:ABC-type glycerol-3-phosphate transport system substrate-binding protein
MLNLQRHRRFRPALLLLAIAGLFAACGQARSNSSPAPATTGAANLTDALDFTAPLVGGGTLEGASLRGRAVLLWFWAPT